MQHAHAHARARDRQAPVVGVVDAQQLGARQREVGHRDEGVAVAAACLQGLDADGKVAHVRRHAPLRRAGGHVDVARRAAIGHAARLRLGRAVAREGDRAAEHGRVHHAHLRFGARQPVVEVGRVVAPAAGGNEEGGQGGEQQRAQGLHRRADHGVSVISVAVVPESAVTASTLMSPSPSGTVTSSRSAFCERLSGALKITALVPAAVMRSW